MNLLNVTTNPREEERYYEKLLLNYVRGATLLENLLILHGKQCENYKEIAKE